MDKRLILLLLIIPFLMGAAPSRSYTYVSGTTIDPDEVTQNEDNLYLYLQAGVDTYKASSITGSALSSTVAITSSGNMTFSGTVNLSGTWQINGSTVTATAANLNSVSGITASSAELNILDGATLSTAELNYVDGVTSNIQTQLAGKSATTGNASIVTVGTITTGGWSATDVPVAAGGTGGSTAAAARSNLSAAVLGANGDITSLSALSTPLSTAQGGTGTNSTTYCALTTNVSGTLPIANGGTGTTSTTFTNLTTNVTGTLPVGNGGTGATAASNAANGVVVLGADGYLANDLVDTTALKTALGEVSVAITNHNITLPGGTYGFYPQIKTSSAGNNGIWQIAGYSGVLDVDPGQTYVTKISIQIGANPGTSYAQQRYVTASGEDMWIFLLIDKITKEIIGAYQAPDHPSYGNGGDPELVPQPFGSYDETKHEIVLLDKETCETIRQESKSTGKSVLTVVNEEYKPNMTSTEPYEPLHSGKFLGQNPVLIETIPDYIKVRKLKKLTTADKKRREDKQNLAKAEREEKEIITKNKLNTLKTKLGLTDEEIELLRGK